MKKIIIALLIAFPAFAFCQSEIKNNWILNINANRIAWHASGDTIAKFRNDSILFYKPTNISGSTGVTSVSRTNGYGILASVANPTTTPNITIGIDSATVFAALRATIPSSSFTLVNGNGTTANGSAADLGGALTGTTNITGSQTLNLGTSGSKLSSINTNTSGNQSFVADGTISSTAPLVYIFGTDSTMILNIDETTDPIPVLCRASNGRLWWKIISGSTIDTGRGIAQIATGYQLNKVRDSLQVNIGAKVDTLSMGVSYLASDFTTSSTTAVNTGLSFHAEANTSYKITIVGTASKATSASGMKLAIGAPSGCTVKGFAQQGGSTLSSAPTGSLITAINTLGSTFATGTGVEVLFRIEATVSNGSTAGDITLQAATVTSNVATVYAQGTTLEWHKSKAQ